MKWSFVKTIGKIRQKLRDQEYEIAIPHFFEEMAAGELLLIATYVVE